jgi:hypothetical protein
MGYLGTPIDTTNQFQSLQGKRFNGDGSTTAFTLDVAPSSVFDIEVFVENVRQDPNSAYALSGTTMTFTSAPASGTNNIYVVHQAKAVGTIDPPATETIAKTFSGALVATSTAQFDTIGVGAAKDLGIGIHVKESDSGAGVNANADHVVIEANGNAGMSILTATGSAGKIAFGDSGDSEIGKILYDHSNNSMQVYTNANQAMNIDAAGHVTKPLQPAFSASSGTQNNMAVGAYVDIIYSTEIFDNNADYNTSNYTFTAPVTGKYHLSFFVNLIAVDTAGMNYTWFTIDTSNRDYRADIINSNIGESDLAIHGFGGTVVADMDASDTAKITFYQDGGTAQADVDANSYFSGYLLG